MKKIFIILAISGLILPGFILAQEVDQPKQLKIPETFDEVWSFVKRIIEPIPKTMKSVWQEAVGIWQKMANWFKNIWNSKIWPKIEWIKIKILGIFNKEVEKRKEKLPGELEKEKQEIKGEFQEQATKTGKGFWERLKDVISK